MPEQASRFRYGKTTASARKVPYQITSSNYNHILRCVALTLREISYRNTTLSTMVGTMLYGYKARTEVLISTDRCTMGITLERDKSALDIYINLSSGHSPARHLDNGKRRGYSKHVGALP